ncbi:anaerobic glycerol-3-phosphate dehydrogenase subunit A [Desulfovibrio ferrophilus]|uniref:FAD dependent oxidoreductase n=1 Tax=Desulfovibrio ferrophilus TaxID=241368 RepID=A0A2Z6B178_9BACT|nr:anaerobic glycerol-3-phosphate dehydrogenase subunit A [Desulfovibrio ferrophilus]BBD09234.1 FAD dependent oxidoreductase [Desulfovibrio ferrophilus]
MNTTVLIIGAGATGTGIARDLALRGVPCLVVERRDVNAGASGGNHGLLHSGGRYVLSDPEAAAECRDEGALLKRLAPQCIDDCGGLFVAVDGDDETFAHDFPSLCEQSGVPCREVSPSRARELEPALSDRIVAAFEVDDASVDPFMLSLDNLAQAISLGAQVRRNALVTGFDRTNGRIGRVQLLDETTGTPFTVEAEQVVIAAGAWTGPLARMAGAEITVLCSQGTLAITQDRITRRVVNRLRPPADADILVPGGTVSILGTTSVRIDSPKLCRPTVAEVDRMIDDARAMIPVLETTRYMRAYAGVRPLVSHGEAGDDRAVSRGFDLIDHSRYGVDNCVTITGGKLTTFRLMAERATDLICQKLKVDAPCLTRSAPLPASPKGRWTRAGESARAWVDRLRRRDVILCECEMVSRDTVTAIVDEMGDMRGRSTLTAIGLRSRVGKGPCQGGFCGPRVTAHLYDIDKLSGQQGLTELRRFIERRWRGKAPVLWGTDLMQAELQEALHCAVFELELANPEAGPTETAHAASSTEPEGEQS